MKTELKNRVLWYDGSSTVDIDNILLFIQQGVDVNKIFVDRMSPDVNQYNSLVPSDEKIQLKGSLEPLSTTWNIPERYKRLDLKEYLSEKVVEKKETPIEDIAERISNELKLFDDYNMTAALRAIIYIIETFEKNNIVWGVGRGSSVSSYVLYLIGVHDVNSLSYDLDPNDFFHD